MPFKTQIGGKYAQSDQTLFQLKKYLRQMGVTVTHPLSDRMMTTVHGQGYAFDINTTSFFEVEKDYYHSIATCDFHCVNNQFNSIQGYLGESASLEMAYAILHAKPILLMFQPHFAPHTAPFITNFLRSNISHIHIHNVFEMKEKNRLSLVQLVSESQPDYSFTDQEQSEILRQVDLLFQGIQERPHAC